jgi:catechol 2,3-dioxygenase-like lactoylglutathione lyase family enzyme
MSPTFNAIGLAAADLATTLDFYRHLGLEFPPGAENEPHVEAVVPGGIRLMWDSHAALNELGIKIEASPGGPSLAFLCADPAEVDSVYAGLAAAGYNTVKEPWDAEWGQRYANVIDPDGTNIDLFAWIKPAS